MSDPGSKAAAPPAPAEESRFGYIAIVGAPNAGKSTLLNQLVGAKVAIVTPKVQTTRSRITAIAVRRLPAAPPSGPLAAQIVFLDTPGIFQPKRRLERAMVAAAWTGAADADLVLLLVDADRGLDRDTARIIAGLQEAGRAAMLVLNKIDTVRHTRLLELTTELNAAFPFTDTFMISALTGDGVATLADHLARSVPPGPWHYPEDQLAVISERMLAAEITREQLFLKLHDELPYNLTVETEGWQERKDGSVRIEQVIYVAKETQRAILLGHAGRGIKSIGSASRLELERLLARRVHLFLFVKVRKDWQDDPERFREMGLDFPR